MRKNFIRQTLAVALLAGCCLLSACQTRQSGTSWEFTCESSEPTSYIEGQTFYLDEAKDKIVLHASLEIDGGEACIQIVSMLDDSVVWEENYSKPDNFDILLENIPAGSEYTFKIKTIDTNKMKLSVTSTEDFVKDKPKPAKKAK